MSNNTLQYIIGTVVKISDSFTASIEIKRSVVHKKYNKRYTLTSKRLVDTTGFKVSVGDTVQIMPTRPISKTKSFKIVKVLDSVKVAKIDEAEEVEI